MEGSKKKLCSQRIKTVSGLRGPSSSVVRSLAAGAKGSGFNSPVAQHVQRLVSQASSYGAVGSLS